MYVFSVTFEIDIKFSQKNMFPIWYNRRAGILFKFKLNLVCVSSTSLVQFYIQNVCR